MTINLTTLSSKLSEWSSDLKENVICILQISLSDFLSDADFSVNKARKYL